MNKIEIKILKGTKNKNINKTRIKSLLIVKYKKQEEKERKKKFKKMKCLKKGITKTNK
jgi:hypothetical protein